ncbi:hypothetical protein [Paramicrobacterium chengjingii]|uniref:Uncharacterized protein n=1 Tax=Paramicrobacterium chengjingii TaxID=2769067 RepID=A0ABX6YJ62_9MICO|nr:hypothetical protein [Microbacterium chengjingii]QPZ38400.1 hypothetical protein HCR76_16715 [Microbacterium chengjingii]
MTPPDDNTDADRQPGSRDEPDHEPTSRVELDLGLTGRVLDWANTLTWGLTAGAGMGTWLTVCLGMTPVFGSDPLESDRITRLAFTTFITAAGVFFLVASTVSALRTLYYAQRVGEATREPDSPPAVDYQAWAAVGTTTFGKAFVGWFALAIVILSVGALMTFAAIAFLAEGEPGSSTLIALGLAVGSVAVGIALIIAVKRMRSLRTRLCPDDPRDKRHPHPRNAQRVPNPASRSHRAVIRTQTIVLNSAIAALLGGIVSFVIWGVLTGQAVMIGGRVRALPEAVHSDLSLADIAAQSVVATILAVTAIVCVVLVFVVIVLGGLRRSIALRALVPHASSSDVHETRPRKAVSEDALTPYSGTRRATGIVGAVAAWIFVAAASPLSTVITIMTPAALVGAGVLAIVAMGVVDIATEPRSRHTRNLLLAAWPSAQAFTTRFVPSKTTSGQKSTGAQKSADKGTV